MTRLIEQTLSLYASQFGDPYDAVYAKLYAMDSDYEGLFLLDTDEGLRRNMMRTTLEIISTYLDDRTAAANRVVGAQMSHITYDVEDAFHTFFDITRDVIAESLGEAFTRAHAQAWNTMLDDLRNAQI
tara:strand:+ start:769 stop:1152 length:384 start_codon:yes stop_codon:yes gene_type:complete